MLRTLGQIAAFMICAQTVLYLRANESYDKYIKLIASMILLLLLLNIFGWGNYKNDEPNIGLVMEKYEFKMQEILSQIQPKEQDMEMVLQQLAYEAKEKSDQENTAGILAEETSQNVREAQKSEIDILIEPITVGGE